MRRSRDLILWILAGLAGALFLAWAYPLAFPFLPHDWQVNSKEAAAIALERSRNLGPPVEDPYIVTRMNVNEILERRLQVAVEEGREEEILRSRLADQVWVWQASIYAPGARSGEWTYRALMAMDGRLLGLARRVPPEERADALDPAQARVLAERFLREHGVDLSRYGAPKVQRQDREARTDLTLRYPDREAVLGAAVPYGLSVTFAGDQLTGFFAWDEIRGDDPVRGAFQLTGMLTIIRIIAPWLMVACVVYPFLRRYHEGEIGVKRASQIYLVVLGLGLLVVALVARSTTEAGGFGTISRQLSTWFWGLQIFMLWFSIMALTAFLSWAVGEALCRERWGHKLAAIDALFHLRWDSATVARSSLRGVAAGVGLAALLVGTLLLLRPLGVWPLASLLYEPWGTGFWPGVSMLAFSLVIGLTYVCFGQLVLVSASVRRFGVWGGGLLAAAFATLLFWPPVNLLPVPWEFGLSLLAAVVLVALFLRYDLLTVLLAAVTCGLLWGTIPYLRAEDGALVLQGSLALAVVALPMLLSARHLRGGKEFVYRYEDVPPHVRRIADRERQRVELETARKIQSSILPELPPELSGVQIAHAYLPASEVGGDFYDVLALEDGRLAVAVGDVAGHGVSSGLVMSMAKSALAVQVTFNPDVGEVFRTLNRVVHQTARKRLLATLCYAVLDPQRRELLYASAGHLYPYRITAEGRVDPLESTSYPLGVRGQLQIDPRVAKLHPGDTLFLFSDGLVEARKEGTEDIFGFDRLEALLAKGARLGVERLRDAVLGEVERFSGHAPREDDQTILVLR
ncbi:MAG TPA: PP2C family protein-serine/threonine phosphatase, partial [Thermoanaerobaculia bacterium]|nr:PP2C family protein-serine/threonine phosphatase [Thermoanaerobaculia bacterium]